jgi:hypothetical protein
VGCACVVSGWLIGRLAVLQATPDRPATGAMAMVDGVQSDALYEGQYLTNAVGRVPFKVRLDRFFIEHYPSSPQDREEGRMPPVKEYRSRVTITEPGQAPYCPQHPREPPGLCERLPHLPDELGPEPGHVREAADHHGSAVYPRPRASGRLHGVCGVAAGLLLFVARVAEVWVRGCAMMVKDTLQGGLIYLTMALFLTAATLLRGRFRAAGRNVWFAGFVVASASVIWRGWHTGTRPCRTSLNFSSAWPRSCGRCRS